MRRRFFLFSFIAFALVPLLPMLLPTLLIENFGFSSTSPNCIVRVAGASRALDWRPPIRGPFINGATKGSVSLDGEFAYYLREGVFPMVSGRTAGFVYPLEITIGRTDLSKPSNRTPITRDYQRYLERAEDLNLTLLPEFEVLDFGMLRKILRQLYDSYRKQGGLRLKGIPIYENQDRAHALRTIHVTVTIMTPRGRVVIGHFQMQTALGEQMTNAGEIVGPVNHEFYRNGIPLLSVETGRLTILSSDAIEDPEVKALLKKKEFRSLVMHKLYQKAFSYLNWDLDPAYVFAQVNEEKKDRALNERSPLKFSYLEPRPTEDGIEHLLTMLLTDRQKTEDLHMKEILLLYLRQFEKNAKAPATLSLSFLRNELESLVRLRLLNLSENGIKSSSVLVRDHTLSVSSAKVEPWFTVSPSIYLDAPYVVLEFSWEAAMKTLQLLESRD